MPLSAARGSWRISARVSLLNQDSPVERVLLDRVGAAAPVIPAQGTVAATALLLALSRHSGPVIFTGLDFCYRDIISHVRPNNFENWLAPKSNRLDSLHHKLFSLAAEHAPPRKGEKRRRSLALETYGGWFQEIGRAEEKRIYRLHPSEIELPGIETIGESRLKNLVLRGGSRGANDRKDGARREGGGSRTNREEPAPALQAYPSREERRQIAASLLAGWIERTEGLSTAIGRGATLEPLMSDPDSLSLLYLCNAAELTETRRILRLRGQTDAVAKIRTILEDHRLFLTGLHREFAGGL